MGSGTNRRRFLAGTAGLAAAGLLGGTRHGSLGPDLSEAASLPWPDQAVLFDGATGPQETYYAALSRSGIQVDLLGFTFSCMGIHRVSGGIVTIAGGPAVDQSPQPVGTYLVPRAPAAPGTVPSFVISAKNDCDLLAAIGAVDAYVQSVTNQAQALLNQVRACRD